MQLPSFQLHLENHLYDVWCLDGLNDAGSIDWAQASDKDLEINKDDTIKVSLVKMDEQNYWEKLKLEEKVHQWEAQWREQVKKEAEAKEQRIAMEKQKLKDFKCWEAKALEQMVADLTTQKKANEAEKRKVEEVQVAHSVIQQDWEVLLVQHQQLDNFSETTYFSKSV